MQGLLAHEDAQIEESFPRRLQQAEQRQGKLDSNLGLTGTVGCGRLLHGGSFLLSEIASPRLPQTGRGRNRRSYITISAGSGTSPGLCLWLEISSPPAPDSDVPFPGSPYFYLVTVENLLAEEGTLGFHSFGGERPNDNPCP
jgi:hypothetical protein